MVEAAGTEEWNPDEVAATVSVGDAIDDWLSVGATALDVFDAFLVSGGFNVEAKASASFAYLPPKKLSACVGEFSAFDSGLPFSGGGDGLSCSMVGYGYA